MSATRFHEPPHKASGPAHSEPQSPPSPPRPGLLRLAAFGAVAWSATLLVMAVQTANPQVVSRDQVLQSEVVVIARRVRPGDEHVRIERVFQGNVAEGDELRVRNLAAAAMADDESYLLSLSPY